VELTELAHRNGGGAADISLEQATAGDLLAANRLYRQTAIRNGDAAVAAVLEDLERVLVEVASSPSPASHDDLARWREQIDAKGLLFKVTVMGARVRERQQDPAAPRPGTKTST
jgi:HPt (histidine-containing phosphotransfer) domain-containing protein